MSTFGDDPDELRDLILSLVVVPGSGRKITPEEFLDRVHVQPGSEARIAGQFLARSAQKKSSTAVELSLITGSVFGFSSNDVPLLGDLTLQDWHRSHDELVRILGRIGTAESVDALASAARRGARASADESDTAQALAVNAVRSLGRIAGKEADEALRTLADTSGLVAQAAKRQIERRRSQ